MNSSILILAVLVILTALVIICFILTIINASKINSLLYYSEDGDITSALKEYYEKVNKLSKKVNNTSDGILSSRIEECESKSNLSLSKMSVFNFDAYDDVTGKLSFALTVLNSNNDGFIITSLYGHNSCNTYVREVRGGETSIKLLDEEKYSLETAKKSRTVDENG